MGLRSPPGRAARAILQYDPRGLKFFADPIRLREVLPLSRLLAFANQLFDALRESGRYYLRGDPVG